MRGIDQLRHYSFGALAAVLAAFALSGCLPSSASIADQSAPDHELPPPIAADAPAQERIAYYIGKLPDRDYVRSYGDNDNPRTWYTAAEALGEIGEPAVPALIGRLDTDDSYELMLALYALMLASQDPELKAKTGGDYLQLDTVLTEETNTANLRHAQSWWKRYRGLWNGDNP